MKRFIVLTLCAIAILLLSACGPSTATRPMQTAEPTITTTTPVPATTTPMPATVTAAPTQPAGDAVEDITNAVVRIVQEQGSGAACNANATYFVYADISSSGPTKAQYRIDATDGSGQVPDGVFDGYASPEVTGSLTFQAAETQSVQLRLMGPYSYPDTITIRVYVNDKEWSEATVVCQ